MAKQPMIEFKNVTKTYPGPIHALKNVSVDIGSGEFVTIVGQSGTGKTTFGRILTAEERTSKGKVVVGGWEITEIAQSEIPFLRRQIGMVFQDFKLLPKKTVAENVAFALEVSDASKEEIDEIVPQVLKIVGLDERMDRFPTRLSGGEQQRVAIARALVHRPKILLADEPTGNLDTLNAQDIIELLKKINEFGTTVVLITHNREVVNSLRRRVITLDRGHVVSDQEGGTYVL